MDNNDENLVKTKTLIEFDQSTPSLALKEESHKLGLTSSTPMGARITQSQENGSGVMDDDDDVHGNSTNGGSGGEDVMVEKKEESVADDFEGGKGIKEIKNDEILDGILMENNGSDDSKQECRRKSSGVEFRDERSSSDGKQNADVSSSIAQRTRNRFVTGKKEEIDVDDGHKGYESDDEDDEENGFCVGDFVWGKVKSHPWWPGRIYDPSDASEFALKYKHEGRLLVGYFGDRTFAWCDPSQLKPFEENFEEMSKQSNLKTFVNAVQEAESEFGRLVSIQMTCSCARESPSSPHLVVNAGVKEGICVPQDGMSFYTVAHFEPLIMLADIKRFAVFDSVSNTLELTVLKSRLSAFFHAKFGYSLPIHCEPIGIEDLTDNQDVLPGPSFLGPHDGDCFMGPEGQPLGQNGLRTPLDMPHKKRKVKSMAALLRRETEDELKGHNLEKTEGKTQSGKSVSKSRKKRWKVSDEDQSTGDDGNGSSKDEEQQSGKLVQKSGRKKRKTVDENQSPGADKLMVTRSSSRKKKEGSARSTTSEKKASGETEDGGKVKGVRKMQVMPHVSVNGGSMVEEGYERISPREKKLSKYLSPPYTNILQRQRSSCSQTGPESGLVFSDVARVGERMAKTAGKLNGSPPLVKCSAETFRKSSKVSGPKQKKADHRDHSTSKQEPSSEVNGPTKSVGSVDSVLHGLRSAALDPLYSRRDESHDSISGFLSSYRNSNYKNGPNYSSYRKALADDRRRKKKRKRNSSENEHGSVKKVLDEVDQQTPKPKPLKAKNARKKEQKSESKADHEVGPSSSAALVITFPAVFPLPAEKDIIAMCSKFGGIDESKTEMVPDSSTAKVVFVQRLAAEAAMDSLQKSMPFGSVEVSYKLEHLATASSTKKQVNAQNKKKTKPSGTGEAAAKSPGKQPSVSPTPESEPLAVIFIKQKLEAMTSMLSETDGKMSKEVKANLENEVKELLKKVKKMTAASSSS